LHSLWSSPRFIRTDLAWPSKSNGARQKAAYLLRQRAFLPNINTITTTSQNKHQLFVANIVTKYTLLNRQTSTMAGGKGKSSGGKSSGGKVGADGGKKQQSHSSKAGLQVSIAQSSIQPQNSIFNGSGVYLSAGSMQKAIIPPPRRVALSG
jgi:hypothetical protein